MKKIFLSIMLLITVLFISANSTYAVLVEQEFNFNVSNLQTTPENKSYLVDTGENLYEKFDSFFNYPLDQSVGHNVTLKRGALTYQATISHWNHSSFGSNLYNLKVTINDDIYSIRVYENEVDFSQTALNYDYTVAHTQAVLSVVAVHGITNYQTLLGDYKILAMLEAPIIDEDGINVSNDFELLPETSGKLINAKTADMVGHVYFEHVNNDLFKTYILYQNQQYNLGTISLPGVESLNKNPLSPGIYWTENNKKYIYYEFQDIDKPIDEQVNIFMTDSKDLGTQKFRPFVQMNLTDSTFAFTDKLSLYAGFHGETGGKAFADVLFPMDLDELISIEIQYKQRWVSLWGASYTEWQTKNISRYKNEVVNMNTTWQHVLNYSLFGPIGLGVSLTQWGETIKEVTPITADYKKQYTDNINEVRTKNKQSLFLESEIFKNDSSLYRVYLQTYNDGRYTGYEIADEIIIIDVMYQYNGVVYHVPYEDIKNDGSFGGDGGDVDGLPSIPEINPIFIAFAVFAVTIGFGVVNGKLFTKKGLNTSYLFGALIIGVIAFLLIGFWPSIFK